MSGWGEDDSGGLDDIFVPRDPETGDPVPEGLPDDDEPAESVRRHPSRLERWLERRQRRSGG